MAEVVLLTNRDVSALNGPAARRLAIAVIKRHSVAWVHTKTGRLSGRSCGRVDLVLGGSNGSRNGNGGY